MIEFLLNQHQQVRGLLDDVLSSSGEERQRYFDTAREMLARHETAEEMIVRPLTRQAPGGEQVAEGRMAEENAKLEKLDVDSAEFTSTFQEFRQAVLDHAAAEERDEFPLLRQNADPDALIATRDRVKRAEQMAPHPPAPVGEDDDHELRRGSVRLHARPRPRRLLRLRLLTASTPPVRPARG